METFYIITNRLKDPDFRITREIQNYIEDHGKRCVLSKKDEEGHIIPGTVPEGMDCALVLGGDGTLIRAARELGGHNIPLLGVNMGTLGYLAEVELPRIREALDMLFSGEPDIEDRMMMRGSIDGRNEYMAMNDIVVTREGNLRVVQFHVYVNGVLLNSYLADGVIISTPTGSTGYNLSAGGPIVEPTASLIVITPICSHALNTRSIVLSSEDEIEIAIGPGRNGSKEEVYVAFDGADTISLKTGDRVKVRRSDASATIMKLSKVSFLETLRRKMKGN